MDHNLGLLSPHVPKDKVWEILLEWLQGSIEPSSEELCCTTGFTANQSPVAQYGAGANYEGHCLYRKDETT